jgi:hypothetical protein
LLKGRGFDLGSFVMREIKGQIKRSCQNEKSVMSVFIASSKPFDGLKVLF